MFPERLNVEHLKSTEKGFLHKTRVIYIKWLQAGEDVGREVVIMELKWI